ncbi:MAG: hypothetical protein UZ17_ACD001001857 [Acidobacteria bacterium OLB17]|nr:MAG: hypothetical protein UZ17_ACD001001857 [Acidobacteria bacterium OLB17]MCZ2391969.1 hypothetical protein [Acidobacteriota bacterium]
MYLFDDAVAPNAVSAWGTFGSPLIIAVVASGITLLGVWLQTRAQAAQQKIAREMELRRELYLQGAEALGKMESFLSSCANPQISETDRNAIVIGAHESLNKVVMIASVEMLEELSKVMDHYSESNIQLGTLRLEFIALANQLKADEAAHANEAQTLTQITTALSSANQQHDKERQNALIAQYNEVELLYRDHEASLEQRRLGALRSIQQLVAASVEAVICFHEVAAPYYCLVREELGFPLENDRYMEMVKEAGQRKRQRAEEWQQDWYNRFSDLAKDSPFDVDLP